jgi:hypothetical protein
MLDISVFESHINTTFFLNTSILAQNLDSNGKMVLSKVTFADPQSGAHKSIKSG